jgi:hypothetical protein
MTSQAEILEKLRALKPWMIEQGIARVRLFGSYARGDATAESDVDLLVELSRPLGLDFFGIEIDLAERLGVKVDLLTEGFIHPLIRERVLREAVDV